MKERALDGLSIGYTVGEFTRGTKPSEPRRTIKTIKALPEVSLVTFPMNELARSRPPTSARCVISRMPCARASFGIWRNHDALTICLISSQRGKRETWIQGRSSTCTFALTVAAGLLDAPLSMPTMAAMHPATADEMQAMADDMPC